MRASWQCLAHHLPLAPLGYQIGDRTPRATRLWLDAQVAASQKLRRRFAVPCLLQQRNEDLLKQLLGKPKHGLTRGECGYQHRMQANPYHLSRARIVLLLAAHSDRHRLAQRFKNFVDLTFPKLHKQGSGVLHPKARSADPMRLQPPEKLEVIRRSRWQVSLYDMLCAYRHIIARQDAARGLA